MTNDDDKVPNDSKNAENDGRNDRDEIDKFNESLYFYCCYFLHGCKEYDT